jgi:N,N'-diacetyllegionaminate synthase
MDLDKVFIIAEAGVNHNGSVEIAKKLIDAAVNSGADAVKFQTFKAENLVVINGQKAEYQKQTSNSSESQFDMIKKLELDVEAHKKLIAYCQEKNIIFLSTPFDHNSINLLSDLGMQIFKIASGEITNLPYLRHIGSLGKKVILSTGMSSLKEVEDALNVLLDSGMSKANITVLHSNTMYPTPIEDVNLNAMLTIQEEFDIDVGYSDHTLGIEVDIAAVAMGASCIEKHFTLDKTMHGPDHKASLEPKELKSMVASIRNIEKALGVCEKKPSPSESANIKVIRKSIVANQNIKKGDLLTNENIAVKRPGGGISPMKWDEVIGTIAIKNYNADELI